VALPPPPPPVDHWGALPLPAVAPATGAAPGDPALTYLLGFLKAFLQDDANLTAAWTIAGVAPSQPIVNRAFAHDPNEGAFNEASLPALYGWRSEMQAPEQLADDVRTRASTITLLWVFPMATQANQAVRRPIFNAIAHAVDLAVERGRTPSFVVPGDTDPNAAFLGSNVWTWMAFWQLRMGAARPAKLDVPVKTATATEIRHYDAIQITLSLEEDLSVDMSRYDALAGLDLKLEDDAAVVLAEDLIPPVV
jgi:hypothetical protein